ncbi:MAG: polyphosphate kinase 2 family protein [Candidatus Firestonebacteria bacterium]
MLGRSNSVKVKGWISTTMPSDLCSVLIKNGGFPASQVGGAMFKKDISRYFRVKPGTKVKLDYFSASEGGPKAFRKLDKKELKEAVEKMLEKNIAELAEAQQLLYANDVYSLLLVFQAVDAAGKDSMIKHVMSGINPQGCQVFSFKQPSAEELDHNFLWRYYKALPERGRIGIFNRSHYEEVLVVKVHKELLLKQKLPPAEFDRQFWKDRYDDINNFEKHLARNGTIILKFFLNVSKEEQKKRFLKRLDDPSKSWKFSAADIAERSAWKDYRRVFEEAFTETSTKWAPWYIIPSDHKWLAHAVVASIITKSIESLKLKNPEVTEEQKKRLAEARKSLENEK